MNSRYRYRLYILTILILFGTGVLISRLYSMQIEKEDYYEAKVPKGKEVKVREPGVRGEIKDRHGRALARNTQRYIVYFNLAEIRQAYVDKYVNSLTKTKLVDKNGAKAKVRKIDISGMVNKLVRPELARYGLDAPYSSKAMDAHYVTHGGLVPFVFRKDLTFDEFAIFAEQNLNLPGVYISASPHREYPYGAFASHILGFIKPWKKGDIPEGFLHYIGDPYGEDGIEKTMNAELTGREGIKTILKNEKGKTIRMTDRQAPVQGADVYLTIDSEVQQLTETVLRKAGKAAAVVMDANTGEILAMASVPNYDPNDFIPAITDERYAIYRDNKANPLLNRAISNFAPGSTFKLPAAIAGCKYGLVNLKVNCLGYSTYGTIRIRCHKRTGHGTLGLEKAIQLSCNPYFMRICNKLGYRKVVPVFQMLGLGKQTGIRLPRENAGVLPGSKRWKRSYTNERMTDAFTGMLGIGQGYCQATPLQLAAIVGTIANGGKYYQPRIISKTKNKLTKETKTFAAKAKIDLLKEGLKPIHLQRIREGMKLAAEKGTARRAKPEDIEIGAKTGTAQTTDQGLETNVAWTAAFAPYDNPRYVVVVAVKRGTSGGKVAGPIVRTILQGLFEKEKGKHFRVVKTQPYKGNQNIIDEIDIEEDYLAGISIEEGETGNEASDVDIKLKKPTNKPDAPTPSIELAPDTP